MFKTILVSATALASLAAAQIQFTKVPTRVEAGQTYTIMYNSGDLSSDATIELRQGPSGNLRNVSQLTDSATGGMYMWTVPSNLPNEDNYALSISQDGDVNYSGQFPLTGGSSQSSVAAPSSTAMSSAMSSASSALSASVMSRIHPSSAMSAYPYGASATGAAAAPAGTGSPYGSGMGRNATTPSYSPAMPTQTGSNTGSGSNAGNGGSSASAAATSPVSTGGAATVGSSMALVVGAVAAFAFLN